MQDFEKLGAFYLGKRYDLDARKTTEDLLLYDAKDLTTHALCVGMTGSGKTGLCLSLLEEAAIDSIPAIVIDPKGDLGNLLLTFPNLEPADFRPWVDESAAVRKGMTPDAYAAKTAKDWREGLAQWGQDAARIARFRDAVDLSIYTPGSNAGLPLTVLRSFDAPPAAIVDDSDAFRERVSAATSGLLALLGIDANPVQSREHILISNILDTAWRAGRNLDLAGLIREIQTPPFERVGIMDLDTFFPAKDRTGLAMTLNNLLASPSFANWLEGDPLDVKRLLYTKDGKPRISIISIAHLTDAERMFMVTILLNEVLTWMRSQAGTSSLRALLYMDEVYGYFPPTANPPSKQPMLTLLKQARAYGLGVVLATQNPVDLDYKGLSNCGTWLLGRLQTERDKARVLDGLEGATAQAGAKFDRKKMEATLSGLGSRVFLMNNVHDDEPVIFQTRWALSYLRGPLTRGQIQTLMEPRKEAHAAEQPAKPERPAAETVPVEAAAQTPTPASAPPMLPKSIEQVYFPVREKAAPGERLVYRPALLGQGRLHFVKSTYKVDCWETRRLLLPASDEIPEDVWDEARGVDDWDLEIEATPEEGVEFAELPPKFARAKQYTQWSKEFKSYLYRTMELSVWRCTAPKAYSEAGEAEDDFRIRLRQLAHEERDLKVEKLRTRYASKLATAKDRLQRAEQAVEREKSQYHKSALDTAVSFGSTVLGALFGRKLSSRTNVSKASTSVRSLGRTAEQRGDIARAIEDHEEAQRKLMELEEEFTEETQALEAEYDVENLELEELSVKPRKSDIGVQRVALAWTPWRVDASGIAEPVY